MPKLVHLELSRRTGDRFLGAKDLKHSSSLINDHLISKELYASSRCHKNDFAVFYFRSEDHHLSSFNHPYQCHHPAKRRAVFLWHPALLENSGGYMSGKRHGVYNPRIG